MKHLGGAIPLQFFTTMTHYPPRLRRKLSAERIAELEEKNYIVPTDSEWMQLFEELNIISDCNETPDLVTP